MINGVRVTLSIWDWQSQRIAVIVPMVSPSYRPISLTVTPPTSVLNFMLKNRLCRENYYPGIAKILSVCRIEVFAEVVTISKGIEYRKQNSIRVSYYIDPDAYRERGLISIVRVEPEPYIELQPPPLDRYTLRIVVKPSIY